MECPYKTELTSIRKDTLNTLEGRTLDELEKDLKTSIEGRINLIHQQIDAKKSEFKQMVLDAFNMQQQEKEKENNKNQTGEEAFKSLDFWGKIKDVKDTLDRAIGQTNALDASTKHMKNSTFDKILAIRKNDFSLINTRKLGLNMRKGHFEVVWNKSKNNSSKVHNDSNDDTKLIVHSNGCYNYFEMLPTLTDENVELEFEMIVTQTENYFYLGVINENLVPSSSCCCCSIQNAFYLRMNGEIAINSTKTQHPKLDFKAKKNIIIRFMGSEKNIYFATEGYEAGPFKLTGKTFRIHCGSCNSSSGSISLISSCTI